jgi:hypothetical protein
MSITIPTTELIGCIADVLPQISDPKGSLAGIKIEWDGEALRFTAYDVHSGATVEWVPGEGAEGDMAEGPDGEIGDPNDIAWGGADAPWKAWIWLPQAKEILKLFKLPAKLWRYPVTIGVDSITGNRLAIEREDGPRVGRLLTLPTANDQLRHIPDVRAIATREADPAGPQSLRFYHQRLGAFGPVRAHGVMVTHFGTVNEPVGVKIGSRFHGFVYPADAKNVRPYSFLRDAGGVANDPGGRR